MPRLYDVLTRHQVYLEGLKLGEARKLNSPMVKELSDAVRTELRLLPFERVDGLSRRGLNALVARITRRHRALFARYRAEIEQALEAYVRAEQKLAPLLYAATGRKPRAVAVEKLLAELKSAKLGVNGKTLATTLRELEASQIRAIQTAVRQAYANGLTRQQLFDLIRGDKALGYRNGLLRKFGNQSKTVLSTAMQHAKGVVHTATAEGTFERYRWISVLDSATTHICRSRNGRIYRYGEGPVPPAHYNCRSSTAPVDDDPAGSRNKETFYEWITDQPREFVRDIYGEAKAEELLSGKADPKDYQHFDGIGPLSLERFATKSRIMRA